LENKIHYGGKVKENNETWTHKTDVKTSTENERNRVAEIVS